MAAVCNRREGALIAAGNGPRRTCGCDILSETVDAGENVRITLFAGPADPGKDPACRLRIIRYHPKSMIRTIAITVVAACVAAGLSWNVFAEEKAAAVTIKQVMKDRMKGDTSDIKKAVKGELSKEQVTSLLAAVKSMSGSKPPKGDESSWKEKCAALEAALTKLEKGEPGAAEAVKTASNCKACHDAHKGK